MECTSAKRCKQRVASILVPRVKSNRGIADRNLCLPSRRCVPSLAFLVYTRCSPSISEIPKSTSQLLRQNARVSRALIINKDTKCEKNEALQFCLHGHWQRQKSNLVIMQEVVSLFENKVAFPPACIQTNQRRTCVGDATPSAKPLQYMHTHCIIRQSTCVLLSTFEEGASFEYGANWDFGFCWLLTNPGTYIAYDQRIPCAYANKGGARLHLR
jgi:hypothetical protein